MRYSLTPIYISVAGALLFLAIFFIIKIREKKSRLHESEDIFDVYIEYIKKRLAKSKTDVTYKEYILISVCAPILTFLVCIYCLNNLLVSIILAVISVFIPELYVQLQKSKNEKAFEKKYLRCLSQMSSSLRSGLSVEQAVQDVCNSSFIDGVLKEEFLRLNAELKFKTPIDVAFRNFAERTNSNDAKDVAAALTMQSEVGGNESRVLSDIANNINQRTMLRKEVSAMFMDTTMTVYVMDIAPILVVIVINLYSKKYMAPFFESWSMRILYVSLWVMMAVGTFITRKIMRNIKKLQ